MPRRAYRRVKPETPAHRVNHRIRFPQIRVIDPDGNQVGVMSPDEGREIARSHGLDLVEVAPDARPPVCRVMDYGKFRYDQSKKRSAAKASRTKLKTIRLRPKTDDHDLRTKMRRAERFLDSGNTVRFEMRLRGRERGTVGRWIDQMREILDDIDDEQGKVVDRPRVEGRQITATVQPVAE